MSGPGAGPGFPARSAPWGGRHPRRGQGVAGSGGGERRQRVRHRGPVIPSAAMGWMRGPLGVPSGVPAIRLSPSRRAKSTTILLVERDFRLTHTSALQLSVLYRSPRWVRLRRGPSHAGSFREGFLRPEDAINIAVVGAQSDIPQASAEPHIRVKGGTWPGQQRNRRTRMAWPHPRRPPWHRSWWSKLHRRRPRSIRPLPGETIHFDDLDLDGFTPAHPGGARWT